MLEPIPEDQIPEMSPAQKRVQKQVIIIGILGFIASAFLVFAAVTDSARRKIARDGLPNYGHAAEEPGEVPDAP